MKPLKCGLGGLRSASTELSFPRSHNHGRQPWDPGVTGINLEQLQEFNWCHLGAGRESSIQHPSGGILLLPVPAAAPQLGTAALEDSPCTGMEVEIQDIEGK